MNNNLHNYECWFKGVVRHLYNDVNAGFAILMIAIPLLERYLRQKSGAFEGDLNDAFYREFLAVFPSLANISEAKDFWQVYRNGLLHQVTLSRANRRGTIMPRGWLSGSAPALHLDAASGEFWVDPKKFAEEVINRIDSDFSTFEGAGSGNHPIPHVVVTSNGTTSGTLPFTPPATGVR